MTLTKLKNFLFSTPTSVINRSDLPDDFDWSDPSYVYIGRPHPTVPTDAVGGTGVFGNPFAVRSREENIDNFEDYFLHKVRTDSSFAFMVGMLRGKKLVCGCVGDSEGKPLPCHGDIIKEYLDAT